MAKLNLKNLVKNRNSKSKATAPVAKDFNSLSASIREAMVSGNNLPYKAYHEFGSHFDLSVSLVIGDKSFRFDNAILMNVLDKKNKPISNADITANILSLIAMDELKIGDTFDFSKHNLDINLNLLMEVNSIAKEVSKETEIAMENFHKFMSEGDKAKPNKLSHKIGFDLLFDNNYVGNLYYYNRGTKPTTRNINGALFKAKQYLDENDNTLPSGLNNVMQMIFGNEVKYDFELKLINKINFEGKSKDTKFSKFFGKK